MKGSSFVASTDRKTSLLRDRSARRAVKRAYRIWVSDAAHHCVQLRIDLLFTMSDNLHRVIEDRRDTNSDAWTNVGASSRARRSSRSTAPHLMAWWSQTGSNRRPPACKAGALPTELWPRSRAKAKRLIRVVGLGRLELPTSRLSSARSNQLSYKPKTPGPADFVCLSTADIAPQIPRDETARARP